MNKKRLLLLLLLFSMLGLLFAQSLESVLPQLSSTQINSLKKGELLKGASFNNNVRELVPNDSIVQRHLLEALSADDSFTVISTILIPYPSKIENLSSSAKQLIIYNTMRRISTQE